eukprot:gene3910-7799_t
MTTTQSVEAVARLTVCLRDMVDFFAVAGVLQHSIDKLENHLESHEYFEFLNLAQGFGKCMAFIDHDALTMKLANGWNGLEETLVIERKMICRKLRNLEGDKNADHDAIEKLQNIKNDIEARKAKALVQCLKFKFMANVPLKSFKDPKFDPFLVHKVFQASKKTK